jgi:hypothetical protein
MHHVFLSAALTAGCDSRQTESARSEGHIHCSGAAQPEHAARHRRGGGARRAAAAAGREGRGRVALRGARRRVRGVTAGAAGARRAKLGGCAGAPRVGHGLGSSTPELCVGTCRACALVVQCGWADLVMLSATIGSSARPPALFRLIVVPTCPKVVAMLAGECLCSLAGSSAGPASEPRSCSCASAAASRCCVASGPTLANGPACAAQGGSAPRCARWCHSAAIRVASAHSICNALAACTAVCATGAAAGLRGHV